jgi:hypothetical protein
MPITTRVMSLNPAHGTEVPIPSQESEQWHMCVLILPVSVNFWLDFGINHHDMTEILLKVVLNTITLANLLCYFLLWNVMK